MGGGSRGIKRVAIKIIHLVGIVCFYDTIEISVLEHYSYLPDSLSAFLKCVKLHWKIFKSSEF